MSSSKYLIVVGLLGNRPIRHDAGLAGKGAGPRSPRAGACRVDAGAYSSWGGPANALNVEGSTLGLVVRGGRIGLWGAGREGVGGSHTSAAGGASAQHKPGVGMATDVAMHMQPA